MTKKIELKVLTRKKEETNVNDIRRSGFVPGIIYGTGIDNVSLKIKNIDLEKVFEIAGGSALVDLQIDENPATKIIIKDVQFDPVKDKITHVDFYQVDMKTAIEVEIPFLFINESKAEKEQGAMMMKNMESVSVKCLPGDLLDSIDIDLEKLENIGDVIRVRDIKLPESFELLSGENDPIISAIEHKIEAELEEKETAEEGAAEGAEEGAEDKKEKGEDEKKEEKK